MPNTKKLIAYDTTAKTVYGIIERQVDLFRLNDADGTFAAAPVDPYIAFTEHTVIKGEYDLSEARVAWNDGLYKCTMYEQAGGSPAPVSDMVIAYQYMQIKSDTEVDIGVADLANINAECDSANTDYGANKIAPNTVVPDAAGVVDGLLNAKIPTALTFTGSDVKATLDGEEVTPTTASKTGYALSVAGILAIWNQLTNDVGIIAGSFAKKLADWVVGTIDTYTGNTKQTADVIAVTGIISDSKINAQVKGIDDIDLSATMKASVASSILIDPDTDKIDGSRIGDFLDLEISEVDGLLTNLYEFFVLEKGHITDANPTVDKFRVDFNTAYQVPIENGMFVGDVLVFMSSATNRTFGRRIINFEVISEFLYEITVKKAFPSPPVNGEYFYIVNFPDNVGISDILEDTGTTLPELIGSPLQEDDGRLPATIIAAQEDIPAMVDISGLTAEMQSVVDAVTSVTYGLNALLTAIGTRMATFSYIAPDNASITTIKNAVENVTYGLNALLTAIGEIEAGGVSLEAIEGSTVLAKEATSLLIKTQVDKIKFTGDDIKATLDSEKVVVVTNEDKTGYSLTSLYDAAKSAASQASVTAIGVVTDAIAVIVAAIKVVTDKLHFTGEVGSEKVMAETTFNVGANRTISIDLYYTGGTTPIVDVSAQIITNGIIQTWGFTDSEGHVNLTTKDGSYTLRFFKIEHSIADVALVVNGDEIVTAYGDSISIGTPASAKSCRVYEYLFNPDDNTKPTIVNATAQIKELPYDYNGKLHIGSLIDGTYDEDTGLVYWDIVWEAQVRFVIEDFIDKTVTIGGELITARITSFVI